MILLQLAGLLHFLIASTNFFAASLFRYRENMARVHPFVREVFWVQNVYIVFTTLFFGAICLFLPHELANASLLSRALSGFLCLFWGGRLFIQLRVYDAATKRRFSLVNWGFILALTYLTLVFGWTASGH